MAQLVTDPLNYLVDLLGTGGKKESFSSDGTLVICVHVLLVIAKTVTICGEGPEQVVFS